ncbi:hypothetical protein BH23ACT5_BH23ACT5_13940 [soil metagenome]
MERRWRSFGTSTGTVTHELHPAKDQTMIPVLQIACDCSDPHRLVKFWSNSLGYDVEDNQDQITLLLESGHATGEDVMEHEGRKVWRTGAA